MRDLSEIISDLTDEKEEFRTVGLYKVYSNTSVEYFLRKQVIISTLTLDMTAHYYNLNREAESILGKHRVLMKTKQAELLQTKDKSGKIYSVAKAKAEADFLYVDLEVEGKSLTTHADSLKIYINMANNLRQSINQIVSTINKNFQ